jgi:ubiquitin-like-conjugating enzyme ATG10
MSHHDEYRQWPFLTQEEFELACAFFDRKYVRAELGPTRRIFKIRSRRNATTGISFIEILRLLCLPDDEDDLALALGKMGEDEDNSSNSQMEIDKSNEDEDEVSIGIMWSYKKEPAGLTLLYRELCGQT